TIPGIGNQRGIVQWAFEEDTKAGDLKRFEVSNGYVVAQVTAKNKAGLQSAETASAQDLPILRNEKKAELIMDKISGTTLEEIAKNQEAQVSTANAVTLGSPTLPGAGNEPKVVGTAFGLEEGAVSKPVIGLNGVYVVEVVN